MKRRILLVDDELAILLTLKAVLEMNDFEVETAASAREARSKLKAGTFHMVITDMRMENESAGTRRGAGGQASPLSAGRGHVDGVPGSRLRVARRRHGRDAGQAHEHHEPVAANRGAAGNARRQEAEGTCRQSHPTRQGGWTNGRTEACGSKLIRHPAACRVRGDVQKSHLSPKDG